MTSRSSTCASRRRSQSSVRGLLGLTASHHLVERRRLLRRTLSDRVARPRRGDRVLHRLRQRLGTRVVTYGNRAPDAVEPRVGWRVWDVVELDGSLRLCSLAFWRIWLPRRPAVAACRRSLVDRARGHPRPRRPRRAMHVRHLRDRDAARRGRLLPAVPAEERHDRPGAGRVEPVGRRGRGHGGWRGAEGYPESLIVNGWTRGRGLRGRLARRRAARRKRSRSRSRSTESRSTSSTSGAIAPSSRCSNGARRVAAPVPDVYSR